VPLLLGWSGVRIVRLTRPEISVRTIRRERATGLIKCCARMIESPVHRIERVRTGAARLGAHFQSRRRPEISALRLDGVSAGFRLSLYLASPMRTVIRSSSLFAACCTAMAGRARTSSPASPPLNVLPPWKRTKSCWLRILPGGRWGKFRCGEESPLDIGRRAPCQKKATDWLHTWRCRRTDAEGNLRFRGPQENVP